MGSIAGDAGHDTRVREYAAVDVFLDGDVGEASFVQVIHGRAKGLERLRRACDAFGSEIRRHRPEALAGLVAFDGAGHFVELMFFTSDVRGGCEGTVDEQPRGFRGVYSEWWTAMQGVRFVNVHEPWVELPRGGAGRGGEH